jgi:hypothetical protein
MDFSMEMLQHTLAMKDTNWKAPVEENAQLMALGQDHCLVVSASGVTQWDSQEMVNMMDWKQANSTLDQASSSNAMMGTDWMGLLSLDASSIPPKKLPPGAIPHLYAIKLPASHHR